MRVVVQMSVSAGKLTVLGTIGCGRSSVNLFECGTKDVTFVVVYAALPCLPTPCLPRWLAYLHRDCIVVYRRSWFHSTPLVVNSFESLLFALIHQLFTPRYLAYLHLVCQDVCHDATAYGISVSKALRHRYDDD